MNESGTQPDCASGEVDPDVRALEAATAKVPVHVVASIIGHKDATTLLKTYAHVLEDAQTDARDTIAGLLTS